LFVSKDPESSCQALEGRVDVLSYLVAISLLMTADSHMVELVTLHMRRMTINSIGMFWDIKEDFSYHRQTTVKWSHKV